MQFCLALANFTNIFSVLSVNWHTALPGNILARLLEASGAVTLGMLADMYKPREQRYPVLLISFFGCSASVFGELSGRATKEYLSWRWIFWSQLMLGVSLQLFHLFAVKESGSSVILDKEAKRRRNNGEEVYGPRDLVKKREQFRPEAILRTMCRPFRMLATEPIVQCISLVRGLSGAIVFSYVRSQNSSSRPVPGHRGTVQDELVVFHLLVGYTVATCLLAVLIHKNEPGRFHESKILWLKISVVLLMPVGFLGLALTSDDSWSSLSWAFQGRLSISAGHLCIYYNSLKYLINKYGFYAASATAGSGFIRNLSVLLIGLTGVSPSMFLLSGLSLLCVLLTCVFACFSAGFRERSAYKDAAHEEVLNLESVDRETSYPDDGAVG
jgi:hypothetical protein